MASLWKDQILNQTELECISRLKKSNSLIKNLSDVFYHLSHNIKLLMDYKNCIHIFANLMYNEVDFLACLDKKESHREYTRLKLGDTGIQTVLRHSTNMDKNSDIPVFNEIPSEELTDILKCISQDYDPALEPGLIIPFNYTGFNLGFFILWDRKKRSSPGISDEYRQWNKIKGWLSRIYLFIEEIFRREYKVLSRDTYLPSYYASKWSRAAILYVDIRNFNSLIEKFKKKDINNSSDSKENYLSIILNEHCGEMAKIIHKQANGRISHFWGAAVMAIFGEHEVNPSKACCSAIYAACLMIERFNQLKNEYLRQAYGPDYEIEYNESIDLNLSIGIDYGKVLFDYLGDDIHKEYSVIGDHVNFAKYLESEALKTELSGVKRPPVLISRTVERCARPWIYSSRKQPYYLARNDQGLYEVFALDSSSFIRGDYDNCMKNNHLWEITLKQNNCTLPDTELLLL